MTVVAEVSYGLNSVPPFAVYSLALAFTNIHTHRNKHTLYSRFLRYNFLYCAWISAHLYGVCERG